MKTLAHNVAEFGRKLAVAAVLSAAMVSPSHALNQGDSITLSSGSSLSGSFLHSYPFSLSVASGIDYFTTRINLPPPFLISGFTATLFSGSTAIMSGVDGSASGALVPNSFFLGLLGPGSYHLDIGGTASGTLGPDSYSGLLRATGTVAPIPEPEVWAMMLVGAGLVFIRLRQKSRLATAQHFS